MQQALVTLIRRRPFGLLAHRREPHRLVFLVGAAAVCLFTSLDPDSILRALLYVVVAASAAAVLVVSAVAVPGRVRTAWALIAASQVFWAIGDGVWTAIDLAGGSVYPSVADVLYVVGYPVLAAGLGLLLRSDNRGFGWGEIVDGTIIALASGLVLWPIVFEPALADGGSVATIAGLAYSTGDVLLLGLLAALFFQGGRRPMPVWFLAGSLVLVFVADLIYYVPTLGTSSSAQTWSDTVWLAAYVLIAAGASHPAAQMSRSRSRADEQGSLRPLRFVGVALLTMPAAFAAHELLGSGDYDWRAFIAIDAAVAALVVLRLSILLRQVERARREASTARNQFETVFESAGLGITITKDGRLIRSNPAFQQLVGFTDDELGMTRMDELIHPDDLARQPEPEAVPDAPAATFARRFLRRDGTVVFTDVNVTRSPTTGMEIGVVADVTGRRELEERIREAHKLEAVGRLAGGIAHDFNNILTIVSGHTELLRDHLPPEADEDVDTILDSVRRANDLTRQLLTFSRRQTFATTLVQPADVFRDTEILIRNVIGASVDLELRIEQSSPTVYADPVQLGQVVLNLAVNARDAMPDGGTLSLVVDQCTVERSHDELPGVQPGSYCRITVEDTGSGMDEVTRKRIFEPFFTTKEVGKGTGLGLATTYGIVTQAGGHIFVESELGRGTRFRILLPAAAAPDVATAEGLAEAAAEEEERRDVGILI